MSINAWRLAGGKGFHQGNKRKEQKSKIYLVEGYEGSDVLQTTSKVDTPSLGHES